ncbi:uncharacterized protein LOC121738901 isoform X2 [Aricia agestis]|uniref:uncharacterized protein LOC121738901 isoform X2 n=1 Tax=Aricia agestis TaxID=91739 RepID=UPI001C2092E2|nr:uncharacterized protein LOC121738901 isoform X2 [Aricia agestis]
MFSDLNKKLHLKYVLVLFLYNFQEIGTYYYGNKHLRMKKKLMLMDKELVMESIRNVKRVDHLKENYQEMAGYEVGGNFYDIRKRYGRMVHLYLTSHNNYDKYPHETLMVHLDEMNHLSIEISHFVEMIQDFEVSNYAEVEHNKRMKRLNLTSPVGPHNATPPYSPGDELGPPIGRTRRPRWNSGSTRKRVSRDFLNNDGGAFDSDDAHGDW